MEWSTSLSQSAKVIRVGGCRPKSCSRDGQRSCRFRIRKETVYEALAHCSLLPRSLLTPPSGSAREAPPFTRWGLFLAKNKGVFHYWLYPIP